MTEPAEPVSRRAFTAAAAWSVPVLAAAVASPLAAASTDCPELLVHSASEYTMYFANLSGNDWQSNSALTVSMSGGFSRMDLGTLSYSAEAPGVNVATSAYRFAVTVPYRVAWVTAPVGWALPVETPAGNGQWTYTAVRTSAIPTVGALTPVMTRPDALSAKNALPQTQLFQGTAYQTPYLVGQEVANGPIHQIGMYQAASYVGTFPRAACNTGPLEYEYSETGTLTPIFSS